MWTTDCLCSCSRAIRAKMPSLACCTVHCAAAWWRHLRMPGRCFKSNRANGTVMTSWRTVCRYFQNSTTSGTSISVRRITNITFILFNLALFSFLILRFFFDYFFWIIARFQLCQFAAWDVRRRKQILGLPEFVWPLSYSGQCSLMKRTWPSASVKEQRRSFILLPLHAALGTPPSVFQFWKS